MGTGRALIVGVPKPSPNSGWTADFLPGVQHDVSAMSSLLRELDFQVEVLESASATASAVLQGIRRSANALSAGDMFVFVYSGHGAPQASADADEAEDQLLLTFDRPIVDDELGACWPLFAKHVRIVAYTDSCNSGSVVREIETPRGRVNVVEPRSATRRAPRPLSIGLPAAAREERADRDGNIAGLQGSLIHFAACQDSEEASDLGSNGAFTHAMLTAWQANFRTSYDELFEQTRRNMRHTTTQQPRLTVYGFFQAFYRGQKPFSPGTRWPPF